jgi:serine/threonine-protein kinase HipA
VRLEVQYAPTDAQQGHSTHVGSLALDRGHPVFQYSASWLANPKPLAPLTMPPQAGLIHGPARMPDRLHGVFADSLPDAWGHLLADRHFAKIRRRAERVTVLDRLAFVGTRGMGALAWLPPDGEEQESFAPDLDALTAEAERVLRGSASDLLPQLIAAAGASGGARPKVLVGIDGDDNMVANAEPLPDGYTAWLVKLGSSIDGPDAAAVEFAYLQMAKAAGLRVPSARLLSSDSSRYFAIARFDRTPGGHRIHALTASGLTDIPRDHFAVEYGELGSVIAKVCANYAEAHEFARRMAFNVLARNRDDHLKNTALLMAEDGSWRLSPAYDLTLMPGPNGEHSMLVDGEGRTPTSEHLFRAAESMGVDRSPMREIIDQVRSAVGRWNQFADEAALPAARRREIASTLRRTRREVLGV